MISKRSRLVPAGRTSFRVLTTVFVLFLLNNILVAGPNAKAVIDRAIESHGGQKNVAKLTTAEMKTKSKNHFDHIGTQAITSTDAWRLPGQYRTKNEMSFMGRMRVQTIVINGDHMWININGKTKPAPREFQDELREQIYAESLCKLFPFLQDEFDISLGDEVNVDDQPTIGVRVRVKSHRDVELFFSKRTGLLLKSKRMIVNPNDPDEQHTSEMYFRDHKDIGGLKYFTTFVAFTDGKKTTEGEIIEIQLREKHDDKLFEMP